MADSLRFANFIGDQTSEGNQWSLESFKAFDASISQIADRAANELIEKERFWKQFLVGMGAQYRGTVITGERRFQEYFLRSPKHHTISDSETIVGELRGYLNFYFHAYSYRSSISNDRISDPDYSQTIGEMFQDIITANKISMPWNTLRVSIDRNSTSCFSYKFAKRMRGKISVGVHELIVSEYYLNNLLGPSLHEAFRRIFRAFGNIETSEGKAPMDPKIISELVSIRRNISYIAYTGARQILPSPEMLNAPQDGLVHAVNFLRRAGRRVPKSPRPALVRKLLLNETERGKIVKDLEALIKSVLLWYVYRFATSQAYSRDVVVVAPGECPEGKNPEPFLPFVSPRLGFALWLHESIRSNQWETFYDRLMADVVEPLDAGCRAVSDGLQDAISAARKEDGAGETNTQKGSPWGSAHEGIVEAINDHLTNETGGMNAARLLADRVGGIASLFQNLSPKFRNEGTAFPLAVIVGREYHSQIIGKEVEDLKEYSTRIHQAMRTYFPNATHSSEYNRECSLDLVLAMIKSRVSLLEWPGSFLFVPLESSGDGGVLLDSLRRLEEVNRHEEMPRQLQSLTARRKGLFALWYDWRGVSIYGGGRALAFRKNGQWEPASNYDQLPTKLFRSLQGVRGLEHLASTDGAEAAFRTAVEPFVRVLTRISETPRHGAMFIIRAVGPEDKSKQPLDWLGDLGLPANALPLEASAQMPHGVSTEWDEELLYRLSTLDGATLIEIDTSDQTPAPPHGLARAWEGARVSFRRQVAQKFDLEAIGRVWAPAASDIPSVFNYGVRRASALALAAGQPGVAVVSVSADGPVRFDVVNGSHQLESSHW